MDTTEQLGTHYTDNMEMTNKQGIEIKPIVFPLNKGTATRLLTEIQQHATTATTCSTYWRLLTDEGTTVDEGNYYLTEEQYAKWGKDNSIVDQYVAKHIGLVII
jgi:hypothetical protein